jgi:hypothetical protein
MDSLLEEDEDEDWGLFDDADAPEEWSLDEDHFEGTAGVVWM